MRLVPAFAFFALLALLCAPQGARAQSSMGASVTVLFPPVTGAGVRPVDFGTVPLGATTTRPITAEADSTAAGIGHFMFRT